MARVEIYTKSWCPYCRRAQALLRRKGVELTVYEVSRDRELEAEMTRRAGGRWTVPQVFVDGRHVGGSQELAALDATGELDRMLEERVQEA